MNKNLPKTNGIYAYRLNEADWTPKTTFIFNNKQSIKIDFFGFIKMWAGLKEKSPFYYIIIKFSGDENNLNAYYFISDTEIFYAADQWGNSDFSGHSDLHKVQINNNDDYRLIFSNFQCYVHNWENKYTNSHSHSLVTIINNPENNVKGNFTFRFIESLEGDGLAKYY